jgi:hypothetical protein
MPETEPLDYIPHSGGRDQDKGKLHPKFLSLSDSVCVSADVSYGKRERGYGVDCYCVCGTVELVSVYTTVL